MLYVHTISDSEYIDTYYVEFPHEFHPWNDEFVKWLDTVDSHTTYYQTWPDKSGLLYFYDKSFATLLGIAWGEEIEKARQARDKA